MNSLPPTRKGSLTEMGIRRNSNPMIGNGNSEKQAQSQSRCEDFDEILQLVGAEGKYQRNLLYLIISPFIMVSPFLFMTDIFVLDVPSHWCHVPGKPESFSLEQWKNLTLPLETGPDGRERFSPCHMKDPRGDNGNLTKCQFGWEYDTSDYSATIPSQFDWVCDNDHYPTDCFTWSSFGSAFGTVFFGMAADKYGRKPMYFLSCFICLFFKVAGLFAAHNYFLYKTFKFLGGLAFPAIFSTPLLIGAEVSGMRYRAWIYSVTWMIWVVGNSLLPFVAMFLRDWFIFGCVSAIPGFFLFCYIPFVHESPRWQITTGRTEEAFKTIRKIAARNGTLDSVDWSLVEVMVSELAKKQKKEAEELKVNVLTLFSKWNLAKNTVMLTISWSINMLIYYGITLNTTKMAGNKFVNYFLLGLVELPGGWLAGKLVDRTGRRWTQVGFFVLCTASCFLCSAAVPFPGLSMVVIFGALLMKFASSVTSLVVYLQGTELYPTKLRSTGSGLGSTISSVVGTTGPYIVYTGTFHAAFPYVLLGVCSAIGTTAAAFLPETFNQSLPETIEDADNFGRSQKFWSYLPKSSLSSTNGNGTKDNSNNAKHNNVDKET